MTNQEAIKYAESKKMLLESLIYQDDYVAYGNYAMNIRELEFVNSAYSALRFEQVGEPLTMEQLREMDGQPAYWKEDESWGIISVYGAGKWDGIPFFRGRKNGANFEYDIESRGMEVYSYQSAHIDREAWEPCGNCKTCENCQHSGDYDPYEGYFGECGSCDVKTHSNFSPVHFCHDCGRPLTEEAWAMLEKRLRG